MAAATAFLTFPASLWIDLTSGVNKLLTVVTGDKGCSLALLTFDKGLSVCFKTVLGRGVEAVPVEFTRTDDKEFAFAVCGKDEQSCSELFC